MTTSTSIDPKLDRLKDAPWLPQAMTEVIVLGGAGGIGSWTALLLSRLDTNLLIYDHDTVERHNMGGQLYGTGDIGLSKVIALKERLIDLSGLSEEEHHKINPIPEKFLANGINAKIMIAAFDNMEGRKTMLKVWSKVKEFPKLFIDGRLRAEYFEVFFIDSEEKIKRYISEDLFDDSEADDGPCTFKSTSHCSAMIASVIVNGFIAFLSNTYLEDCRILPYKVQGLLPMFELKTYD